MHEIRVGEDLRGKNMEIAAGNREHLRDSGVVSLNIMSAPGAGKTSLLVQTIPLLLKKYRVGVIEGDVQTNTDAERVGRLGIDVFQIQTGGVCHLDAAMVHSAMDHFDLEALDLLLIENVGNLVCPAEFDLGENARVMLLSVTEGDDKPKKYPLMFRQAGILLLNKIDLLPMVDFDPEKVRKEAREINPSIDILEISCKTGEGMPAWLDWIDDFHRSTEAS